MCVTVNVMLESFIGHACWTFSKLIVSIWL